ncbi:oxygenase [Actinoplanes sp. TBRC 11911]|uniref:styrene monooxygenase/indole monooxygenase family protein n=1 Tax=Actinoplanes sp. TBRC 11911 TaxID=2729386 RepID=UPI00145DD476|nr:styrene monooxygenase/indole monooxygenase family protein [Actinoplanes sp. TBRC 11911]NMO55228.1 oxygenase [Actinoplanes sp. TBRC 11911]
MTSRRIAIVGAGQSGLLLGLGLRANGYDVTIVADKRAEEVRSGPLLSSQLVFGPAIALERQLGVHFWPGDVAAVTEISFTAAVAPGAPEPAIAWSAGLAAPAQGVDQRLKVAAWMTEYTRRGGEIRYQKATLDDIEGFAREFDLVVVAAGRGPQFERLFPRDDALSPYRQAQRFVAALQMRVPDDDPIPASLRFSQSPAGEVGIIPALTVEGRALGMGLFAVPGGPMDVWDGVSDTEQHFELVRKLLRDQFPWRAEIIERAEPLSSLRGRITPTVRHPVGTLPSGAKVLALGDTAVTNDPLAGQGANLAAYAARSYASVILEQGDRAFDEGFMRASFARFWTVGRYATRFSNDLLAPPAAHMPALFQTAQVVPEVARRFVGVFENPATYTEWATDGTAAMRYLEEARARARG